MARAACSAALNLDLRRTCCPKTAYFLEGGPEEPIEFTPKAGSTGTIRGRSDLEKLSEQSGSFLLGQSKAMHRWKS